MCLAVCHARRHWNSPSYRSAAGIIREQLRLATTPALELSVLPHKMAQAA
jgi:hypothetical protein